MHKSWKMLYVFNAFFTILYFSIADSFIFRYELNFAVNVLGTYAITELLLPSLEKAAPDARVITVSSGGMYTAPLTKDLQVKAHGKFMLAMLSNKNTNGISV